MINVSSSVQVNWKTPDDLFNTLDEEFHFNVDVAANNENSKCDMYIDESMNALVTAWAGVCWCHPPFGRGLIEWVRKAVIETWNGVTTVMFLPIRSDRLWWHDLVIPFASIRYVRDQSIYDYYSYTSFPLVIAIFRGKPLTKQEVITKQFRIKKRKSLKNKKGEK